LKKIGISGRPKHTHTWKQKEQNRPLSEQSEVSFVTPPGGIDELSREVSAPRVGRRRQDDGEISVVPASFTSLEVTPPLPDDWSHGACIFKKAITGAEK